MARRIRIEYGGNNFFVIPAKPVSGTNSMPPVADSRLSIFMSGGGALKVVACAMSRLPMNELPELFPYVEAWVTGLQQQAIATGKSYPLYYPYARAAGVIHPEKIRILSAAAIPEPTHPRIAELAKEIGLLTPATGAITVGYGVIVRADCVNDLRLIVHELVHVAQYERFGVADFLRVYIRQLNDHGYNEAPFEVEAEMKTADILRLR